MRPAPKIQLAVDVAVARGIGRLDAAPPLHRLLWSVGVNVRPPHFAPFSSNALLAGGFMGACTVTFSATYALHLHPQRGAEIVVEAICTALLAAVAFGLAMATIVRFRARKANLPTWEELRGPED